MPVVHAHGIVGRADLPIPAELFGAAAALVLAVSFVALAAGWSQPRLQRPRERPLLPLPRALDVLGGVIGVALFVLVVVAGLAGTDSSRENLAPTFVYVVFWVGVAVLSLLFGDVFRVLSPWRALGRLTGWIVRRAGSDELAEPLPYPPRLGRWPAVAGLVAFAAVELCWGRGDDPQVLAVLAVLYLVVQLAGQGLYGVDAWSRHGDAFGVYFSLFASLAPVARREGRLVLRAPLAGATRLDDRPAGTVAVLVAGIAATAFDGAKEGAVFGSVAPGLQDAFTGLGLGLGQALELAFLLGLLATLAIVAGIYLTGVAGMRLARPAPPRRASRFAHSLVPIAAAYVVAHYVSLLAYQGQSVPALLSDPLGDGSDLIGAAGSTIDYGVVTATGIWYVQVAALVLGHVGGLVLAHDRALTLWPSARAAVRSQCAMLGVMVIFTCLGLWQLSAAAS